MVESHHDGRDHEHSRIPIEREQRQRTEHMKVRFEASPRQMNEQRPHQHLRNGDRLPRHQLSGHHPRQRDRQADDRPAENQRGPNMNVDLTRSADPRAGRVKEGGQHRGSPLARQQEREEPIGAARNAA